MSTKRLIGKSAVMGACLLVVAFTSGCGFFCTDDSQCRSNICRVPLCVTAQAKIANLGPPTDLTELLLAILPPTELQP